MAPASFIVTLYSCDSDSNFALINIHACLLLVPQSNSGVRCSAVNGNQIVFHMYCCLLVHKLKY